MSKKRQDRNFEIKVEKMYKPRTLSRHKYEPPAIEVNLTDEITGSLRTLKAIKNSFIFIIVSDISI